MTKLKLILNPTSDKQQIINSADKPQLEWEYISPTYAEKLLKKNVSNRAIKSRKVNKYCEEIKLGRWANNGETIKICEDGTLMDGQHRLSAIIKSNIGMESAVARNLKQNVFHTIDVGAPRSARDFLESMGFQYSSSLATAAKLCNVLLNATTEISASDISGHGIVSIDDIMYTIETNPGLTIKVQQLLRKKSKATELVGKGGLCALSYLFDQKDKALSAELYKGIETGAMLGENSVIRQCRELLTEYKLAVKGSGASNAAYRISLVVRTWNHLRDGLRDTRLLQNNQLLTRNLPIPLIK